VSEFSESYHLRTDRQESGVALLEKAGCRGFVFPAVNGWVTVLPESEPFVVCEPMIEANEGLLVYYWYAEDHGWGFSVYQGDNQVCDYAQMWSAEDEDDSRSLLDMGFLVSLAESAGRPDDRPAERLRQLLDGELDVENPAYEFARLLGLPNYEWTSYMYMADDYDDDSFPGVVRVE
jgi:hypothetical protein